MLDVAMFHLFSMHTFNAQNNIKSPWEAQYVSTLGGLAVHFPDDVRLATISNRDYGPTYIQPLSRIESDNAAVGAALAVAVLTYLRTGTFPQGVVVGPKYERGTTL